MKMFKNKLERIASLLGLFALFFYFASPASANTNPIDSVTPVLSASVDSVVDAYADYVLDPAIVTIEKSNSIFAKLIEDTTSSLSNHYDNYTSGLALLIAPDTKSEKPAKNLGMSLTANPLTETSNYLFNLYYNNFISPLSDTWLTVLNFSKDDQSEPVNISEVAPTDITNTITPSVSPAKPQVKPNSPITYITNSNRGPQGIAGPQGPRGLQGIAGINNIDASLFVSRIDFDNQVDRIFNSIENGLEDVSSGGGGSGDALTTNPLSQFASTTSAELAGVISDESGTGVLVFANTPTLITPVLGAATGTSLTLSSLGGSGTRCVQVDNSGVLAIAGAACGAGGGQTPWTSDIDADNFKLLDLGTNITARADLTVTATSADLNLATATSGNITLAPASTGSVQVTSGVTTGTGTSSGLSVVANSLTTGTGLNIASSSLSSGSLLNLAVTGTAGLDNQKGINVSMSGANGTGAQTTYGGYFSNTHTGTSTNIGLYATASGGSNNYAAIFDGMVANTGLVGIGTTAPTNVLDVKGGFILHRSDGSVALDYNDAASIIAINPNNENGPYFTVKGSTLDNLLTVRPDYNRIGIGVAPTYTLDILNTFTWAAQTAEQRTISVANTGLTMDTTASGLSSYGGYFSSTSTRSAGANNLTNVGLYATASGAQLNYAAIFEAGNVGIGTTTPGPGLGTGVSIYSDNYGYDIETSLIHLSDEGDIFLQHPSQTPTIRGSNTVQVLSVIGGIQTYSELLLGGTTQATNGKITIQPNTASANSTITVDPNGVGIGVTSPDGILELGGNRSKTAWGVNGVALQGTAATYTDTSSSGTVASAVANSLGIPTFAASSATTYTASANLYIAGPPTSGTNVTQSNPYALWVDSGNVRIDGTLGYNGDLDSYLNFSTGELRSSSSLTIRSRNGEGILLDGSGNAPAGGGARLSLGGNSSATGDAGADEVVFYNGGAETMSIDAVGLATFAGDVQIGGSSNPQGLLLYQDSSSNGIRLADTADGDTIIAQLSQVSDKGYLFLNGDSGSGIELFGSSAAPSYIDAGNFGIGTTAPDRKMEINSATGINLRLTYNDNNGTATNYADLLTTATGDLSVVPSGGDVAITGNLGITSTNTTQTTTASALALNVNSLTTGTGLNIASSSLSSGALINLAVTGTAGLDNQKGINVSMSGANGTGAQTTYGGYFSNTHTGTSTNIGLYATASGGSNNYAAIFDAGFVGIGTTAPGASLQVNAPDNQTINVAIFNGNYTNSDYPIIRVNNAGSSAVIGFNTYVGNEYSMGVTTGHDFILSSGRALTSAPIITISDIGDIDISTQDLTDGVAGPVFTLGRNNNATNTGAGSINFQSKGGTAGYVWQDNAGNMRIHTAAPSNANDTAGTVIGTQTSTRNTKQDIEDYSDYNGALSMVLGIPLHTFRYKKDVEGYGENSILAKTRIGYMADEVPGDFMWGNSIDQVSVNGILLASIKALDLKITDINNLEEENDWRDNLIAWFANAENRITRIFTGEICLTDPGEEAVCLNRTELQGLKSLLNGQISIPEYTPPPNSDPNPTPEPTPETEATPESEPSDTGQEEETPPPADEAPPAPEPSPEPTQ